MEGRIVVGVAVMLVLASSLCIPILRPAMSWSNGGYSVDPEKPAYGTHDWIAQQP